MTARPFRLIALTVAASLALALPGLAQDQAADAPTDQIVEVETSDAAMSTAIAEAQHWLPNVFAIAIGPDGTGHPALSLKVAFPVETDQAETEVVWVGEIIRGADGFQGNLQNQPAYMPELNAGDMVQFSEDMIADWGIVSTDARLYGHFTTRLLIGGLPEDQAAQISALLSDDPVPASWR